MSEAELVAQGSCPSEKPEGMVLGPDDTWETPCASPRSDGWHCEHWYDGEECHWCGDKALTDEELIAQGSEPR